MRTLRRWNARLAASALHAARAAAGRARRRPTEPTALAWRSVDAPVRGGEISALAFDAASATLAIGDVRGVLVGRLAGGFERRLRRGPVRDLAFLGGAGGGSLLAATPRGLFLLAPDGAVSEVSPGPGPTARAANRLAVAGGWIGVATDDGVFFSRDARRWLARRDGLPGRCCDGARAARARRARSSAGRSSPASRGARSCSRRATGSRRAKPASRRSPSGAPLGGPVDLALAPEGADVVSGVCHGARAARRCRGRLAQRALGLPPGADVLRFGAGAGHFFLATLRGLFVSEALEGPWRRAEPPAGSAAVRALAGDPGVLFAAADSGLLAGAAPAPRTAGADTVERRLDLPEEPGIEQVHRAALAYLRLEPERIDALRRGVARRGWLPVVSLRGGYARDQSHGRCTTRPSRAERSGISRIAITTTTRATTSASRVAWDLGDVAYHPEEIDVSHEARDVIELRDDVLDEITQLYFERLRVLAQLRTLPAADARRSAAAALARRRARRRHRCVDRRLVRSPDALARCASPHPHPELEETEMHLTFRNCTCGAAGLLVLALLPAPAHALPVISEVFYDAVGSDDGLSFVELYGQPGASLDGLVVDNVNGANGAVGPSLALSGTFPASGLFVVADATAAGVSSVAGANLLLDFDFQNGPDSIVLRLGDSVLDAVGYGVFAASEVFAGEGAPAVDPAAGASLARRFADVDTGDNAADFISLAVPTPGSAPLASVPEPGQRRVARGRARQPRGRAQPARDRARSEPSGDGSNPPSVHRRPGPRRAVRHVGAPLPPGRPEPACPTGITLRSGFQARRPILRAHGLVRRRRSRLGRPRQGSPGGRDSQPPRRECGGPPAVITGFNTNVRHGGRLFHVQTEDSGKSHPHVISHVYYGGTILASEKHEYEDLLGSNDLTEAVRALMEGQHKAMVARLKQGALDAVIAERLDRSERGHGTGRRRSGAGPARPPPAATARAPERAFGEGIVSQKPLDEVILDYLVEKSRGRGSAGKAPANRPARESRSKG